MGNIRPYDQQVELTGAYEANATPQAYGYDAWGALGSVAESLNKVSNTAYELNAQQDVTKVHQALSQAQVDLVQKMQEMRTQAPAGDPSFATNFIATANQYLQDGAQRYQTREGQQTYSRMAASLMEQLGVQALSQQASLNGEAATSAYNTMTENYGRLAFGDPANAEMYKDQMSRAIQDPASVFARVDPATRENLQRQAIQNINEAAIRGFVQRQPEALLSRLSPDKLSQFRPTSRIVDALAGTSFKKPITNQEVTKYSPVIEYYGKKFNVDPNFMAAQIQQESGGDASAVGPETATGQRAKGIAQFMPETAKEYGIDPSNPEQSIQGQARYMSDLLTKFNNDYIKAAAAYNWGPKNVDDAVKKYGDAWIDHAPLETQLYISDIFTNIGSPRQQTGDEYIKDVAKVIQDPGTKVSTGIAAFDELPWDKQYDLVNTAVTQVRANQVRDAQQKAQLEEQRKGQQDALMVDMLKKAVDGDLTADDVVGDNVLTFSQRHTMLSVIGSEVDKQSRDDPSVVNEMYTAIHSEGDDRITSKQEILDVVGDGITAKTAKWLMDEFDGKGSPDAKLMSQLDDYAKSQLSRSTFGDVDAVGEEQLWNWRVYANGYIKDQLSKGKTMYDLLHSGELTKTVNLFMLSDTERRRQLNDRSKQIEANTNRNINSTYKDTHTDPSARKPGNAFADWALKEIMAQHEAKREVK